MPGYTMGFLAPAYTGADTGRRFLADTAFQLDPVLNHAPFGCVVLDADGRIIGVNAAHARLVGYAPEELVGQDLTFLVPPGTEAAARERHHRFMQHGEPTEGDWAVRHHSGNLLHVVGHSMRVERPAQPPVRVIYVFDVTQRHQRATEAQQYRAIVESSDDAIVAKTLDGTVTAWNQGAQRLFGWSAAEMIGQPTTRLMPADRKGEEQHILERLRRGEAVRHFETQRVHRDGHMLQVSVSLSPVRDASGQIVGISKIARDIGARKAMEARLQHAASVFENTQEGVLVMDGRGGVLDANPAFRELFQLGNQPLLGRRLDDLLPSRGSGQALAEVRAGLREHGRFRGEIDVQRPNGSGLSLLVTVNSVPGAVPGEVNRVAVLSDITPLRQRQQELQYAAHHDPLTGLPNRALFYDRLAQAMGNARRRNARTAVVYIDLDGFKQVNDTLGHAGGDAVLRQIGARFKAVLRETDTLARLGGDEFAAVMVDAGSPANQQALLQRLLDAAAAPNHVGSAHCTVSASLGAAVYNAYAGESAEQLLARADRAMYRAKQDGKNRCVVAEAT